MWASFAEKQGGIFLVGVEMRWKDNPYQFFLAVYGVNPTLLNLAHFKLIEDVLVFVGNLFYVGFLLFLRRCNNEKFVGVRVAVAHGEQLTRVAQQLNRSVIVPALCELHYLTSQIGLIHVYTAVPNTDKIKCLRVGSPAIIVYIRIERLGNVAFLTRCKRINAKAVAVAFATISLHTLPSHVLAIGRELGINVVTHVIIFGLTVHGLVSQRLGSIYGRCLIVGRLAKVGCFFCCQFVQIDIRVGRDGILAPCFLPASIGNSLRVGAPCQLLNAAKWFHWAFVGFALQYIFTFGYAVCLNIGHKGMLYAFDIMVPVAIHQVGYFSACGLGKVGRVGLDNACIFD